MTNTNSVQRPAVRCHAHRTNGEPCGNYAMHGASVCHAHGGRAPAVRKAAQRRMVEATLSREVTRLLMSEQVRQEALRPWTRELGPRAVWGWHKPEMLRRIAAEMRSFADELSALAKQN